MTDAVQPISDEQLPMLLAALTEAARADQRTATRFVPAARGHLGGDGCASVRSWAARLVSHRGCRHLAL